MTKHTSGPWIGYKHSDAGWDIDSQSHKIVDETGVIRADDARLIAAAPDLLTHLKHMIWLVETELKEDGGHILQGAKDAIAKAEGCHQTFDCNAGDHADCCPAK